MNRRDVLVGGGIGAILASGFSHLPSQEGKEGEIEISIDLLAQKGSLVTPETVTVNAGENLRLISMQIRGSVMTMILSNEQA